MLLDLRRSAAPPRLARSFSALLLALVGALAIASAAPAATGELHAWGDGGLPNGLFNGGVVAVDSQDGGAVYVADQTITNDGAPSRIRKFSATGQLLGTVLPPDIGPSPSTNEGWIAGLAVDHAAGKLYALEAVQGGDPSQSSAPAAWRILQYSITPDNGGNLVKPSGAANEIFYTFNSGDNSFTYDPTALALDPRTQDLVVLGSNDPNFDYGTARAVVQHVTRAGAKGSRIANFGAPIDSPNPTGLAIGPNSELYFLVGRDDGVGVDVRRAPAAGGASTVVASDHSPNAAANSSVLYTGPPAGSQLAVSPDGGVVYVGEAVAGTDSYVRGLSTQDGSTQVVYGGGRTSCRIDTPTAGLGLAVGADGTLVTVAYDGDPTSDASVKLVHVLGAGGTGCPNPQALFTVNGRGDLAVPVDKGATVAFDASASDLTGGTPSEVDWDLDGDGTYETVETGSPASLRTSYKFTRTGTVRVGLKIHISGGVTTDAVFHQVVVTSPPPTATVRASATSVSAGGTVTFDGSDSLDPTGTATAGPTHTLARYRWSFGDGQTAETATPTIAHAFANSGQAGLTRTVTLNVVNNDGVVSTRAASVTVTVNGTPVTNTPVPTPAPTPTPRPAPTPTPTPTPVLPRPSLSAGSVDAKGTFSLKVTCPSGTVRCTGTVSLTIKVRQKVKGRTRTVTVKVGSASFSAAAGKSTTVRIKLSAKGKSLLRRQHKLSTTAAVSVSSGGRTSKSSRSLTLKPARKG